MRAVRGGQAATVVVARDGDQRVVGCGALELHGDAGLLRSVCVTPAYRRKGLGRELVRHLLDLAGKKGLPSVYLLTTTVPVFFGKLGFEEVERRDVHPAIKQSTHYQTECPRSAVVMRIGLAGVDSSSRG